MNNIIDGRLVSDKIKNDIKNKIEKNNYNIKLVVIQIGDDKSSFVYIKNKKNACLMNNISFEHIKYDESVSENTVISKIKELNLNDDVTGILVQLPLPLKFNEYNIVNNILPIKDVDGLTYKNIGNLVLGNNCLIPCTALGIIKLFNYYNVNLEGKNVCIIGRSNLVGKPLIQLLLRENATVSICHSKSIDIKKYTKLADVLIVAVGSANFIKADMINNNCIVIDVGINKNGNKLSGDVDFDNVSKKAKLITPVPGGVGPMTVACLLSNLILAYEAQNDVR